MTFAKDVFSQFIQLKTPRTVWTANGEIIYGTGIGNVLIHVFLDDFEIKELVLKDVLYVPNLAGSLISVSKLQDCGILTQTTKSKSRKAMILSRDGIVVANASRIGSQYIIDSVALEAAMALSDDDDVDGRDPNLDLWHQRFGHIGVQQLRGLKHVVSDLDNPIPIPRGYNSDYCEPCIMAKQLRVINRQAPEKVDTPLGRVFTDIWGPYSIPTLFGERYIYTITDQATRKSWVYLAKDRKEFRSVFLSWKKEVELQSGHKLKIVRLDNAKEFLPLEKELAKEGVKFEWTTPYTPEQNGVSERLNRTLVTLARAMLINARLPYKFWGEAVKTACYLRNRIPIGPKGVTPEEAFTR